MERILIVDDEEEILATLKAHFELNGVDVDTANSAMRALELHEKNLYAVVVTDIRMPELNGIEFMRKVKLAHPTGIVYIMTGYSSLNNLVECLELGAVDYFVKPFADINFVIKSVMDGVERYQRWRNGLIRAKRAR